MGHNWSSCTRPLLYNFDQGTPVNDINDVTEEKLGAIWVSAIFENCRNENRIWTISPVLIYIESYFWCHDKIIE